MKYLNLVMVAFQGWNLTLSIKEKSIFGIVWNVFFILVFVWLWFKANRPTHKVVEAKCSSCGISGLVTAPPKASDKHIEIIMKHIPCPECGKRLEVIKREANTH